jgi:hypothetical protein
MKPILYWAPRILAILFIAFISIFALDVFSEPHWYLALFMHLIPSFILTLITIIAWKKEKLGGILFLILAVIMGWFFHSVFLAIPNLIIGFLFIV